MVAALALLGFAGTAQAASGPGKSGTQTIEIQDRCDPATFDAALHDPNACVGNGDTTFDEFFAEFLKNGSVGHWRFHPDKVEIRAGQPLRATNVGGEFHTFTRVDDFELGCIPLLNPDQAVSSDPRCDLVDVGQGVLVPKEFTLSGVPPHASVTKNLTPGTYKFQCFVHPWMHTTVTVRG